jgi:2-phosphosulfolactate phosphatase
MPLHIEVLFSPAEFAALSGRDLSATTCVVFDVLRATSSMLTALNNGTEAIIPVSEIAEALAIKQQHPDVLLAGEREGLRIRKELTGGIDFDFGNSPREFTSDRVSGKTLVMTTTNGTRALRSCVGAERILIGAFLNLGALADLLGQIPPDKLLLICSGTFEEAAYEDTLACGRSGGCHGSALVRFTNDRLGEHRTRDLSSRERRLGECAGIFTQRAPAAGESRLGRRCCRRTPPRFRAAECRDV